MPANPLLTTLLDLDAALHEQELIIGGGYGLFLKQTHIGNPCRRLGFVRNSCPHRHLTAFLVLSNRRLPLSDFHVRGNAVRDQSFGFSRVLAFASRVYFAQFLFPRSMFLGRMWA